MGASSFNDMELDAIGEIMNISLGASATAVSTMLGTKVNITTPVVLVQSLNLNGWNRQSAWKSLTSRDWTVRTL